VDVAQWVGVLGIAAPLTVIIPFVVRLFVKPLIAAELEKQTTHFEKLFNNHLRYDHGFGGGKRSMRNGPTTLSFTPKEEDMP